MKNLDKPTPEQIKFLYEKLIEIIETTSYHLYKHTIERLKRINPTLDEIAEHCTIFITLIEHDGTPQANSAIEAVTVIREAAQAVTSEDQQTVIDCAYHLEDYVSRLRAQFNSGGLNG